MVKLPGREIIFLAGVIWPSHLASVRAGVTSIWKFGARHGREGVTGGGGGYWLWHSGIQAARKADAVFRGFREYYSLFAATGTFFAALEDELKGYELRKGTVRFPLDKPVPVKLISRIAKLRAAGIAETGEKGDGW